MSTAPVAAPARVSVKRRLSVAGMSLTAPVLFAISFLVLGSGYMDYRPSVMGLRVHPYLIPVGAAFPLVVLARITEFPFRVLAAMLTFVVMYCFSVLAGAGLPLSEVFKSVSALVTIVTCALLVRKRGDFVAGVLGLSLAVALLAWPALRTDVSSATLSLMEDANKNSYSLFALPAMLLAGYIVTRMNTVPLIFKGAMMVFSLASIVAIFLSANRSGYLGTALVGLLLFWDRRIRGLLLVGTVGLAAVFYMTNFADTRTFDERMKMTVEGTQSDTLRIKIFQACAEIAFENPIVGVSPNELPIEIGRKLGHGIVDPHNVFGHVAAGSGLICFAALMAIGWTLFFWHPRGGRKVSSKDDPLRAARSLMRMLVILWVVRGMFSREILYNPSFCIAIGLAIGLCMLAEKAREEQPTGTALAVGSGAHAA